MSARRIACGRSWLGGGSNSLKTAYQTLGSTSFTTATISAVGAIIYNDTDANKRALGYVELSSTGSLSIVSGAQTIDWQGAGTDVLRITPS